MDKATQRGAKACKDHAVLIKTSLFGYIGHIANKKSSMLIILQGMNQSLAQISMLVIYEASNNKNVVSDSAHVFASNQTSHGYTAYYLHSNDITTRGSLSLIQTQLS